jgi:hypothetical protein
MSPRTPCKELRAHLFVSGICSVRLARSLATGAYVLHTIRYTIANRALKCGNSFSIPASISLQTDPQGGALGWQNIGPLAHK